MYVVNPLVSEPDLSHIAGLKGVKNQTFHA